MSQDRVLGAWSEEDDIAFRVWAPFADAVSVIGDFNDWKEDADPLTAEESGTWSARVSEAGPGDEYRFVIRNGDETMERIDPYARQVTGSSGCAVIAKDGFDWDDDAYRMPAPRDIVIYEMHIGTFADEDVEDDQPGTFDTAIQKFPYLEELGVTAIEVMPPMEFAGGLSWGYNVALPFAIESEYGGPRAFKRFVNTAHQHGIAVLLDVVYNHFGPSDLDLWRFDGWYEDGYGGIYFYNDWRAETPWGDTRPDYGRDEVRDFICENAVMWARDYHVDGLRWDMTAYIRNVKGNDLDTDADLPSGWRLMQEANGRLDAQPRRILTIAEDLQQNEALTAGLDDGGAGFDSQWDVTFARAIRPALTAFDDGDRQLHPIREAMAHRLGSDVFDRVIYTESHDEVANGKARLAEEIWPDNARSWYAKKRTTLGAVFVFTAPGIPMIFQGQEFMEEDWFDDRDPLDWSLADEVPGIVTLYADLISLRLNEAKVTQGLKGQHVAITHLNASDNVMVYHRWDQGGPRDSTVVVVNLANRVVRGYRVGLPRKGTWRLRFDSHSGHYDPDFEEQVSTDLEAEAKGYDDLPARGEVAIAPYSAVIFSQDD